MERLPYEERLIRLGLFKETMCPICLEYLMDPVTMDCGHNFCQGCISNYCDKWEEYGPLECPVCRDWIRKGSLWPNWQLGNIVRKIRQLELNPSKENLCETHQEKLNLFCEEDREAVCVACWRSPQHRSHKVLLMEEAGSTVKRPVTLHVVPTCLFPACPLQEKMEAERQKILSVFKQLGQLLEDQEQLLLAQLEKLDKEIRKNQDENATKVSKEIPRLSELISEMEGMCRQPAMNMTLDPDMAHPELIVSEDGKSARWGFTEEDLPDNPERFDILPCVLGCDRFTSGRHCWEVEVGGGRFWAVGVARESVRRKGWISHNPEGGIWAVERCGDQYQALTSPESCLPLNQAPSRMRVSLNCEQGQVTFFDAENQGLVFTFPPASFTGEKIRPWLQESTGVEILFLHVSV
uniref:Tripartite motif containing 39 n=1 Tax=Gopherus agassizii TaxID=38772 RepID=A0A452GJY1_9SAUR